MANLRDNGAGLHGMTRVWHSSGWSAAGVVVVGAVMGAAIAPTTGFASDLPAPTPAAVQAASVPAAPDWIVTIGGELPHRAKVGRRAGRHLPPNRRPLVQHPQSWNASGIFRSGRQFRIHRP